MCLLNTKVAAGGVPKHIKSQLYHLEGVGQHTAFHLTCIKEIHDTLDLLSHLYRFHASFSTLNVRENQISSYEDLMDANKEFARPYKTKTFKTEEVMKRNRQQAMRVIDESEQKLNLSAKMIGKQILVWHQIIFKKNYAKAAKYLGEWMPLQLKIAKKDPFFTQSCDVIVFLSYFLIFTNDLSGDRKIAIALLKQQQQYRLDLKKLDSTTSVNVDKYAGNILSVLMEKIAQEHYLTSSLYKLQKIESLLSMMKEKFGKSLSLKEISHLIP